MLLVPLWRTSQEVFKVLEEQTDFPLKSQGAGQSHRGPTLKQMGRQFLHPDQSSASEHSSILLNEMKLSLENICFN